MATASQNYATAAALTITLTSLGDGSYRQSTAVDNGTNKYLDAIIGGSIQVGTSPTDGSAIEIFAYGTYDNGTTYTAGCSGSDAAYTADGEESLLAPLALIIVDSTSDQDYVWGPVSVAQAFGGFLPEEWGIVVRTGPELH